MIQAYVRCLLLYIMWENLWLQSRYRLQYRVIAFTALILPAAVMTPRCYYDFIINHHCHQSYQQGPALLFLSTVYTEAVRRIIFEVNSRTTNRVVTARKSSSSSSSSASSSVYLGSTSNQETQKHNMNNKNMRSKGQKGRDGTYNCP